MVAKLAAELPSFPGESNRARCFDHVVNLCAKSVLRPFDVEQKKAGEALSEADEALRDMAAGLELDGTDADLDDDDEIDRNDEDTYSEDVLQLSDEKQLSLENDVYPIKFMLAKVSISFYLPRTWLISPLAPQTRRRHRSLVHHPPPHLV